jgi:hypothetical protein
MADYVKAEEELSQRSEGLPPLLDLKVSLKLAKVHFKLHDLH